MSKPTDRKRKKQSSESDRSLVGTTASSTTIAVLPFNTTGHTQRFSQVLRRNRESFMTNEFVSMTEIGKILAFTSHEIGRMLRELGLRTQDGKPSDWAFGLEMVRLATSGKNPNVTFYEWHKEKTLKILDRYLKSRRLE